MLLDRQIDAVTFTSASTVRNFAQLLGERTGRRPAAHDHGGGDRPGHRRGGAEHRHHGCRRAGRVHDPRARGRAGRTLQESSGSRHGAMMTTHLHHPAGHDRHTQLDLRRRPRRLRRSAAMRSLVRETRLSADMFIYPLFVCSGEGQRREVGSMPGVFQLSVDEAVRRRRRPEAMACRASCCSGCPTTRTRSDRPPTIRRRRCSPRSGPSSRRCRACSSSPTSASANTPPTATAASWSTTRSPTTPPSSSWCAPRCRTPSPAPTSSRRRT